VRGWQRCGILPLRVFDDTIYLYTGNDSSPEDKTWVMTNWQIYSSTDLVNWEHRGVISPRDNYMGEGSTDCWAGDAATRNGKYFFYFSDRGRSIGVMVADSPVGPFKDALGEPLVSSHDPTILIDDDAKQTPYIVYGAKESGGFYIAELQEDMVSLKEEPRSIQITGQEWENAPRWMDKNYIFKHEGRYYLSWGRDFAISENVYGPYESVGAVGHGHELNDQHFDYGVARYDASWPKIQAERYYEISSEQIRKRGNRADGFVLSGLSDGRWIQFSNVSFFGIALFGQRLYQTALI
jgi:hypothetical protein